MFYFQTINRKKKSKISTLAAGGKWGKKQKVAKSNMIWVEKGKGN